MAAEGIVRSSSAGGSAGGGSRRASRISGGRSVRTFWAIACRGYLRRAEGWNMHSHVDPIETTLPGRAFKPKLKTSSPAAAAAGSLSRRSTRPARRGRAASAPMAASTPGSAGDRRRRLGQTGIAPRGICRSPTPTGRILLLTFSRAAPRTR